MQSRSEPAIKFTYNPYTETWQSQQVSAHAHIIPHVSARFPSCIGLAGLDSMCRVVDLCLVRGSVAYSLSQNHLRRAACASA
jgi:hypothetical protein